MSATDPFADPKHARTAAAPEAPTTEKTGYDPSDHDVDSVLDHIAGADDDELERVAAAEEKGKNRKTLMAGIEAEREARAEREREQEESGDEDAPA